MILDPSWSIRNPTAGAWRWRKRGNGDGHHSGWRWTHLQSTRHIWAACLFDVWIFVFCGCTNMPQADWVFSFQSVLLTLLLESPLSLIQLYCQHTLLILFQIKLQTRILEDNWPAPLFWNLQCVCSMACCRVNIWKLWRNAVERVFRLAMYGNWQETRKVRLHRSLSWNIFWFTFLKYTQASIMGFTSIGNIELPKFWRDSVVPLCTLGKHLACVCEGKAKQRAMLTWKYGCCTSVPYVKRWWNIDLHFYNESFWRCLIFKMLFWGIKIEAKGPVHSSVQQDLDHKTSEDIAPERPFGLIGIKVLVANWRP